MIIDLIQSLPQEFQTAFFTMELLLHIYAFGQWR